jgi:hypothetical protein
MAIMLVVIITFAVTQPIVAPKPASIPVTGSENPYLEFRRGEWASANANAIPAADADLAFRRGEWFSSFSAQQAYIDQRFDEYASANAQISSTNAYLDFRRGEWYGR